MNVLPLSPGLLVSMAARKDHAVFGPDLGPDDPLAELFVRLPWRERIPAAIDAARDAYDQAVAGELEDAQVLEEATGKGFYSPDLEDRYLAMLAGYAGMTEHARRKASSAG